MSRRYWVTTLLIEQLSKSNLKRHLIFYFSSRSSTIMLHDSCTSVSVPLKWLLESITRASQISYSWKLQYHLWTRIQIILFMDVLFEFKYNQVKQSIFSWEEWSLFIYGSYAYYCSQLWDVRMVKSLVSIALKKLFNLLKRTIYHSKIFHTENRITIAFIQIKNVRGVL